MTEKAQRLESVAIVGGGISGLAAALHLHATAPHVQAHLFEAGPNCGGILQTTFCDDYLIERAADSFLAERSVPWMADLCKRFGLSEELAETDPRYRRALVVKHGKLHPVPAGFRLMLPTRLAPLLTTPLLGPAGKLRMLAEPWITRGRLDRDESLAEFARRRFGNEVFTWLIEPLVAGIYTADANQLSVAAALPHFARLEHEYGSLARAAWALRRQHTEFTDDSGARYASFLGPRQGMAALLHQLAERFPRDRVHLNSPVRAIAALPSESDKTIRWRIHTACQNDPKSPAPTEFAALILALPGPELARLLEPLDARLSHELRGIPHASSSIVCLGYHASQIRHPLDAFGLVVPQAERRQVLAISFASRKFAGRAPVDHHLLRVFLGGALQPELADLDDRQLETLAHREAAELLGVSGQPHRCWIQRWPQAMPQYHVGHLERLDRINDCLESWPGLYLTSNALRGVGLPQCVRDATAAAQRALEQLNSDVAPH